MRPGPIFREVVDKFDCGELDVRDSASNQHDSNLVTITPLLRWISTKHNLIDLAKKAVHASESKKTSKKSINTQSKIADVNDMNIQRGFKNSVPKD